MLTYEEFCSEVEHAYRVLPDYAAVIQNDRDIHAWFDDGFIDEVQYSKLQALNKNLYACY